jgi:hypothetical protein
MAPIINYLKMKIGIRTPSLNKRITAHASVKRTVKNSHGLRLQEGING